MSGGEKLEEQAARLNEVKSLTRSISDDLAGLTAEIAELRIQVNNPEQPITRAHVRNLPADDIALQVEALGHLTYEALSESCLEDVGDGSDARLYAEQVSNGVKAFCQSIALQIRAVAEAQRRGQK